MENTAPFFIPYRLDRKHPDEMVTESAEFFRKMDGRRTVRQFSDEPVPLDVIRNAIRTAGTAPSGAHMQPWHFALITNPEIKKQIREAAEAEERENYDERMSDQWKQDLAVLGTDAVKEHLTTAPVLLVVFKQTHRLVDGKLIKNYYVQESVGIAIGMLITALHNAGLATLTHTPTPMNFITRILNRPDFEFPVVVMPVGYPAKEAKVPDLARKALNEILTEYS